jgi:hypothetical protein
VPGKTKERHVRAAGPPKPAIRLYHRLFYCIITGLVDTKQEGVLVLIKTSIFYMEVNIFESKRNKPVFDQFIYTERVWDCYIYA